MFGQYVDVYTALEKMKTPLKIFLKSASLHVWQPSIPVSVSNTGAPHSTDEVIT